MKKVNIKNYDEHKKNLEKMISEQKEQIIMLENEYNERIKPNIKHDNFSQKINNDLAFFQKQNIQYGNELNSIKNENNNLKKLLDEKEKLISKFQKVVEEAKIKMEILLFENKKIMKENEKLKEEIIKYKTVKKHQEKNNILNEVNNLKNELSQMERYLIPRINEKFNI